MADEVKLEITSGDTVSYVVNFVDEDGASIDITGWIVYFTAKVNLSDEDSALTNIKKEVTEHSAPLSGETTVTLTSLDTTRIPGNLIFDLRVKTNLNEVKTIIPEGTLVIKHPVRASIT